MTATPSVPSWMLVRLALETSNHHASADDDRLRAMDLMCAAAYRRFLARIHGFESAVETACLRTPALEPAVLRPRLKGERLRQDLRALGMTDPEIAVLPTAANVHIASTADALGWMFVVERQTLLSGLIRRHLMGALPTEMRNAAAYLTAYGASPGARFRAFGDALGAYTRIYPPDLIVAAARDAFRAQRQWYQVTVSPTDRSVAVSAP